MVKVKEFIKLLINDLKDKPWPEGTTVATKNEYRWKVIYLMGGLAVASLFVWPPIAVVPLAVAARKFWIIKKDK